MNIVMGLGLLAGIVLVIAAWLKRREPWAPTVFWIGAILLATPIAWEFVAGMREGIAAAAPGR